MIAAGTIDSHRMPVNSRRRKTTNQIARNCVESRYRIPILPRRSPSRKKEEELPVVRSKGSRRSDEENVEEEMLKRVKKRSVKLKRKNRRKDEKDDTFLRDLIICGVVVAICLALLVPAFASPSVRILCLTLRCLLVQPRGVGSTPWHFSMVYAVE